jgi:hypothetical protein
MEKLGRHAPRERTFASLSSPAKAAHIFQLPATSLLSSLRTQGPITTGCSFVATRVGQLSFRQQASRGMGPCVRRDDRGDCRSRCAYARDKPRDDGGESNTHGEELIRGIADGTRPDESDRHPYASRFEFSANSQQGGAAAFNLLAIVFIPLKELPGLGESLHGTRWPPRRCPEAAERGIPRRCTGATDRLKRSQQIERLIPWSQVTAGKY